MAILTSADVKRLMQTFRERARRVVSQSNKIIRTASQKRVDSRSLLKVADSVQSAYGFLKDIEDALQQLVG